MSVHPNDTEAITCETASHTNRYVAGSRENEGKPLFFFAVSHNRRELRIDLK